MSWYWYLIIFLLIFIALLIISNVKVNILLNKERKNDFIQIKISLFFGLINLTKKIPLIKFESFEEGIKFKSETDGTGIHTNKKDRITPEKAAKWEKDYRYMIKNIKNFYRTTEKLLKHVYIEQFKWESNFGTGDAMNTGILTGVIWGIKGISLGIISNFMILHTKPTISVTPIYDKQVFKSRLECIIKVRLGHVILTGIKLLFKLYQGGGKIVRRTSYTGINENSYGKS